MIRQFWKAEVPPRLKQQKPKYEPVQQVTDTKHTMIVHNPQLIITHFKIVRLKQTPALTTSHGGDTGQAA